MRKITCADCGRRYDYDVDDFCPKCGSYNPPPDTGATRLEQELLSRFQDGQKQQTRSSRPRPAPGRTLPRPHTPRAGGEERRRTWAVAIAVAVIAALVAFLFPILAVNFASLGTGLPGTGWSTAVPEPDTPALEAYPTDSLPQDGVHEQYEPFRMNGTQDVTVGTLWEPYLNDELAALYDDARCVAVDLEVTGGYTRDDLYFFMPFLSLSDGTQVYAEDSWDVLDAFREVGLEPVTPYDAQWADPLYGQMVFFLPDDCTGDVTLVLPEAAPGDGEEDPPAAYHLVILQLPWSASEAF